MHKFYAFHKLSLWESTEQTDGQIRSGAAAIRNESLNYTDRLRLKTHH